MKKNKSAWEKEFSEFMSAEPEEVPFTVSASILKQVREDLHPSAIKVFTKVAFIQALVGVLTLLFCPQFGISFTSSMGIMPYLMKYGESVCMFGCGAFFTGISLLVVSLVLRPEEVRVFKEHEILQLAFLSTLTLGSFVCLGGEVVFSLGLMWALGAIVGGAVTLEIGWVYRRKIASRSFI